VAEVATHPCPSCGTETDNADVCDACGIKRAKEIGKGVGKAKHNGQDPKRKGKDDGKK
jgi:primosomal protein N'